MKKIQDDLLANKVFIPLFTDFIISFTCSVCEESRQFVHVVKIWKIHFCSTFSSKRVIKLPVFRNRFVALFPTNKRRDV